MEHIFRKARLDEIPLIWHILQQAIERRRQDGSAQWQDGYPNPQVVQADIENGVGYVLTDHTEILAYCAVLVNDEPAYADIEGAWLTAGDFVVFHRVAVSGEHLGKGQAARLFFHIEQLALSKGISSVRADTNFDNPAMLRLFDKMGYAYCGEVYFRGSARKAFEKVVKASSNKE
jgi:GNAT superfamily N-acetyltransferase